MQFAQNKLLNGFEVHSTDEIRESLELGIDPNALIDGKTPMMWLIEMYYRSNTFSECVRTLVSAGARLEDSCLLAVLLDDSDLLRSEMAKDRDCITRRIELRCAFTPLMGATLLHVAAEYGLVNAASTLLELGADPNAKANVDQFGFNGHTPIFHTVCQHRNCCKPVLELLLSHGADPCVQLSGISWGKGFEWETTIFDPTPMSYAQAGLHKQFQRAENDVYENIRLLAKASRRPLPDDLNVPNRYLHASD